MQPPAVIHQIISVIPDVQIGRPGPRSSRWPANHHPHGSAAQASRRSKSRAAEQWPSPAGPTGVAVVRGFKAVRTVASPTPTRRLEPLAAIKHRDRYRLSAAAFYVKFGGASVFDCIVERTAQHPSQGLRTRSHRLPYVARRRHRLSGVLVIANQAVQECIQVHSPGRIGSAVDTACIRDTGACQVQGRSCRMFFCARPLLQKREEWLPTNGYSVRTGWRAACDHVPSLEFSP